MIESFFTGVLLGWGVAIPIGPINVLIMSYALKSYSKALALGLGATLVDVMYLLLVLLGVTRFFTNPLFIKIFSIFGACYLTYMAWGIYKGVGDDIKAVKTEQNSHLKTFIKGMFLNITNPYVVMFWLSVSATFVVGDRGFFPMLFGLFSGILSWILFLPFVVYRSRNFLSKRAVNFLSYASAVIILGFAVYVLYSAFKF